MSNPETFTIEVYSGPSGKSPISVWADHWRCTACQYVMTPDTVDFDIHCPLHNPMYCSGSLNDDRHVQMPCVPFGEVFLFNIPTQERTVIGRIK